MSRIGLGFVAAWGAVAGTVLACQLVEAAKPVSGAAPGKSNFLTASAAAESRGRQQSAAGASGEKLAEEPLTVLKSGPDHIRVLYRLKNCPASDVNQDLQQLFRLEGGLHKAAANSSKAPTGSGIAIVPCAVENSLLISGAPEAVEEVLGLLDKLDQPAGMLLLEMEIGLAPIVEAKPEASAKPKAKSPAAKDEPFRLPQRPEKLETTARVRLITLDDQPAFIQLGSRVPRVSSMSVLSTGGETRSTTLDNVGLIVGVTPRIDPLGAVVMQIDVEQMQLGPESEGSPISVARNQVVRSPRMEGTTVQTTVRILDGQTMILGSAVQKGKSNKELADKELVIIVTPHIIRPEEAKKVARQALAYNKSTANAAKFSASVAASPDAKVVVTRFLEAMRKGDNDAATKLLTKVARQKVQDSGRCVAPPAHERAKIQVEDVVYPTPDHKIAHVTTKWTDLDEMGKPRTDKATWVCRLEPEGWRVAGFAAYVFEGEDPLLLSFEDPEDLAKKQKWLLDEINRRAKQEAPSADDKKPKGVPD